MVGQWHLRKALMLDILLDEIENLCKQGILMLAMFSIDSMLFRSIDTKLCHT